MNRITSFPPIITEDSQVLILGSIPGVKSLEMQEYYAHPQNKFWKILFELFDENFSTNYEDRIKLLKVHHIALWDVIDSCERKGSLDVEIKNENANNIVKLLIDHPNIKAIFCNGHKSFKNLQKTLNQNQEMPIFVLPSTSPAHTLSYNVKFNQWSTILKHLK